MSMGKSCQPTRMNCDQEHPSPPPYKVYPTSSVHGNNSIVKVRRKDHGYGKLWLRYRQQKCVVMTE